MLVKMSISGGILIVVVLILRLSAVHKFPKRFFMLLWDIALLRLLLPVSIPVRLGIAAPVKRMEGNIFVSTKHVGQTADAEGGLGSTNGLFLLWLSGVAVLFLVFAFRYWKEYKTIREALPFPEKEEQELRTLYGIPRWVKLRKSDRIITPLTVGIFAPKIILSSALWITDETQLKYIIKHEMVHICRADNLRKILISAAVCLHWYHPFVWVMWYLYQCDLELACDEKVISVFGETEKEGYAMTLVALEESKTGLAWFFSSFGKNAVKERIVAIMKFKKMTAFTSAAALLLAGTSLTAFAQNVESEKSTVENVQLTAQSIGESGNTGVSYDVSKENKEDEDRTKGSVELEFVTEDGKEPILVPYEAAGVYVIDSRTKGSVELEFVTEDGKEPILVPYDAAGVYVRDSGSEASCVVYGSDSENGVYLMIEDGKQTEISRQEFYKLVPDAKGK